MPPWWGNIVRKRRGKKACKKRREKRVHAFFSRSFFTFSFYAFFSRLL